MARMVLATSLLIAIVAPAADGAVPASQTASPGAEASPGCGKLADLLEGPNRSTTDEVRPAERLSACKVEQRELKAPTTPKALESFPLYAVGLSLGAAIAISIPTEGEQNNSSDSDRSFQTEVGASPVIYASWNFWPIAKRYGRDRREYCTARNAGEKRRISISHSDYEATMDGRSWEADGGAQVSRGTVNSKTKLEPDEAPGGLRISKTDGAREQHQHSRRGLKSRKRPLTRREAYENELALAEREYSNEQSDSNKLKLQVAADKLTALAYADYVQGAAQSCGAYWAPGLFVGYAFLPLGAEFDPPGAGANEQEFAPGLKPSGEKNDPKALGLSLGLNWNPSPYANLLVGVTAYRVPLRDGRFATSWQPTIGFGTSLDLFSKLF